MMIYIIIITPFKDRKFLILSFLNELTLTSISICCTLLAYFDTNTEENIEKMHNIAWAKFYVNIFMKIVLVLNYILEILISIKPTIDDCFKILMRNSYSN
jgi:hypothetical protein